MFGNKLRFDPALISALLNKGGEDDPIKQLLSKKLGAQVPAVEQPPAIQQEQPKTSQANILDLIKQLTTAKQSNPEADLMSGLGDSGKQKDLLGMIGAGIGSTAKYLNTTGGQKILSGFMNPQAGSILAKQAEEKEANQLKQNQELSDLGAKSMIESILSQQKGEIAKDIYAPRLEQKELQFNQKLELDRDKLNQLDEQFRLKLEASKNKLNNIGRDGLLSDKALREAAKTYGTTGNMPALGMGTVAAINRSKIMNMASDLGYKNIVNNASTVKSNQAALGDLSKRAANVNAFAGTAFKNLDIVLKESEKTDRSGIPILDKAVLYGKSALGIDESEQIKRYDAAVRTAINEYAKVVSSATGGGVTSDTARKEVEAILHSSMSKAQVAETINLLKQEMQNRIDELNGGISNLQNNISNISSSNTNNNVNTVNQSNNSPPKWDSAKEKRLQELRAKAGK